MDPMAPIPEWMDGSNISHIWKRNYWRPKIMFLSKCRTVKWLIVNLVKSLSLNISSVEQLCTTSVKMNAFARTNNQPNMIIQLNKQASGFFTVALLNLNQHNFPQIQGSFDTCMNSIGQQLQAPTSGAIIMNTLFNWLTQGEALHAQASQQEYA